MPQPVSYNPGTPVSGSIQENNISYVVDGQQRNYRGGFGGLSWMSEVPAENNVIFIGNSTSLGRGPAGKPLFYPSYNNSSANIVYAANTLPGSPRNFTTTGSAYNWAVTNNFFINNSNNPIPRIDADGLSFYVDANQPSSYPQTGTSWYDLSGFNRNSTLTNGPTFNSNGWIEFDGADDRSATSFGFLSNSESHEAWIYCKGNVSTYNMFMAIVLPYYGFFNGNTFIVQDFINGTQVGYYTGTLSLNRWYHFLNTRSYNGTNTTLTTYINGTLSNQSTYSGAPSVYGGTWTLGNWDVSVGASYPFYGDISGVKFYTKALTLTEVKQNYFQSNIIQDGLVFMLDANNLVSYPKSGTNWYSLTSSFSASLVNGPAFNNSNGGSIVFDGTDDYGILNPACIPSGNEISISFWNYGINAQNSSIIASSQNSSEQTLNIHLPWGNSYIYWDCGSPFNRIQKEATPSEYQGWHHWVFTKNASTGNMSIYLDGSLWHSDTGLTSTIPVMDIARIGSYWNSAINHNGRIAQCLIYSKSLSPSEIQQNYQATKDKFQGQQIVTNGLIVNLDAANKDSYPGTGTTWTDLTGNANNGTLINGPSFNIDSGGCIDFDGIDDSVAGNKPVLSAVTLEYYCKLTGNSTGGYPHLVMSGNTFIGFVGNTSSARFRIAINPGAGYSEITSDLLNPSATFKLYSMTYDGTTVRMFVNGVQQASTMNIASTFELMTGNAYQLSAVTTPSYDKAPNKMAAFRIYNRALSATEIAQNYNATKGRFGL